MKTKVLIIEDDLAFAALLKRFLEKDGYDTDLATEVAEGFARAERGNFDVVLTDLHFPGPSGLELISQVHQAQPHLPVILMTAKHTTQDAIEATKRGAYDYFAKPDVEDLIGKRLEQWRWVSELSEMLEKAADVKRLTERVGLPGDTPTLDNKTDRIIGNSRGMQNVYKEIGRVAATPVTVLIRGETGTGKELVARAIWSHSDRHNRSFIVVNCAAIPENLLESELFGHEAGAFTGATARRIGRFEQAHHGTIFLDEIGDMDLKLQQKLLRVLQEKTIERVGGKESIPVDVRVIAATHRDLEQAIQDGEFRTDLFFRLNVAVIALPPLTERREDIAELVEYFRQRDGAELGATTSVITTEAVESLSRESWSGNVRQLRNVIRKALILARGFPVTAEIIAEALAQMTAPPPAAGQSFAVYVSKVIESAKSGERDNVMAALTEVIEERLYGEAIRRAQGDQSKAARWLGISRPTMRDKLSRYSLHPGKANGA